MTGALGRRRRLVWWPFAVIAWVTLVVPAVAGAQVPRLANGRIETRTSSDIAAELPRLAATLAEPAWVGYAQPLIAGNHEMCDYSQDGRRVSSADPIRLEPADAFFVLFRLEAGRVARIRAFSLNCPLDAGGKTVQWFTGVTVDASLRLLRTFMARDESRALSGGAMTAIALTAGERPLEELLALARNGATSVVKGDALFWLAQRAGQQAAGAITAAVERDPDTEVKKRAVFALSQLPKEEGVPLLIQQARTNSNPAVRRQAMFWLGQSKDPRALRFFEEILSTR